MTSLILNTNKKVILRMGVLIRKPVFHRNIS